MKTFLYSVFINNWQRKCLSLFLAILIWFVVNHNLTGTRTISNIPIRIVHLSPNKTVEGIQPSGILSRRISLTLVGKNSVLDELTPNSLEVVIDASGRKSEWVASIDKKNLVSLNPEINLNKGISRVFHQSFIIRLTNLVTERIPVLIPQPIGEPPADYQLLDVFPYRLYVTVKGPEEIVQHLKSRGVKLPLNLSKISKGQLDILQTTNASKKESVSFYIPDDWKQIHIPAISNTPIAIDDPEAKNLRIDFIRSNLFPLIHPIPVTLFFPSKNRTTLNPDTSSLEESSIIKKINGIYYLSENLFAKGVSAEFLQAVQGMLQVTVVVSPKSEKDYLEWSVVFITPHMLENHFVSSNISSDTEFLDFDPKTREQYLRNCFRSYMDRFRLFKSDDSKLELKITLDDDQKVRIVEWESSD